MEGKVEDIQIIKIFLQNKFEQRAKHEGTLKRLQSLSRETRNFVAPKGYVIDELLKIATTSCDEPCILSNEAALTIWSDINKNIAHSLEVFKHSVPKKSASIQGIPEVSPNACVNDNDWHAVTKNTQKPTKANKAVREKKEPVTWRKNFKIPKGLTVTPVFSAGKKIKKLNMKQSLDVKGSAVQLSASTPRGCLDIGETKEKREIVAESQTLWQHISPRPTFFEEIGQNSVVNLGEIKLIAVDGKAHEQEAPSADQLNCSDELDNFDLNGMPLFSEQEIHAINLSSD